MYCVKTEHWTLNTHRISGSLWKKSQHNIQYNMECGQQSTVSTILQFRYALLFLHIFFFFLLFFALSFFFHSNSICITNVMESFRLHVCYCAYCVYIVHTSCKPVTAFVIYVWGRCFMFFFSLRILSLTVDKKKRGRKKERKKRTVSFGKMLFCWSIFHCFSFLVISFFVCK